MLVPRQHLVVEPSQICFSRAQKEKGEEENQSPRRPQSSSFSDCRSSNPQFTSAVLCTAKTLYTALIHGVVSCLTWSSLCFFHVHVVERQLGTSGDVLQREEGQIIDSSIEAIVAHGEQAAVRIAAVVDEAGWAAHFLSIGHVAIAFVKRTGLIIVFSVLVQREQVGCLVITASCFTGRRLSVRDQLTEVAINILSTFEVNGTA
jgi:hypothetical protein